MSDVFVDVKNVDIGVGIPAGTEYTQSGEMAIGQGSKVFRADQSGIWLGAEKFADAPFSVDMLGNLIASSATLSGYSKIYIWKQDGIPTSTAVGDLWIDTNDSNKVYRAAAVGADAVTAGEWEEVTTAALLLAATSQSFTGSYTVKDSSVFIDGVNGRIVINDGSDDRVVIGNV